MRTFILTCVVLSSAGAASAQPAGGRFYAGATTAVDGGTRGNIDGGAIPSAGLLIGFRLSDAWSLEGELEKPFHSASRSSEAFWVSYPPTSSANREEFERYGIKARFDRSQEADFGWSATAMWRSREPGRVNVGLSAGVAGRNFSSRTVRENTFVSPLIDLPATHPSLAPEDVTRRNVAGGLTGGIAVMIRATSHVVLAPEVRYTYGMIDDDPYRVFRAGLRTTWAF